MVAYASKQSKDLDKDYPTHDLEFTAVLYAPKIYGRIFSLASSAKFMLIIGVSGKYSHVKGFEHETTEMVRVTEGQSFNMFLIPCRLCCIINLIRSSNCILRITRHVISWLQLNSPSGSRSSKNSWTGNSFDLVCLRGEHRCYL